MRSIRLASIVLAVGFGYARFNHAATATSEPTCGSSCTTSHGESEPFVTINSFIANKYRHKDTEDMDIANEAHPATDKARSPRGESFPLFCFGKDLERKDIAGVCMDGNFLWYKSDDCTRKCKCDDNGKIYCDIPSDCGPQKDIVQYCESNPSFACTCLTNRRDTQAVEKRQQSSTTQVSGLVAMTKGTTPTPTQATVNTAGENAASRTEQAQDLGVPEIPPCWVQWNCWVPHTNWPWYTTLATSTTKPA